MSCDTARGRRYSNDERCGPDAEYFEARRLRWLLQPIALIGSIIVWLGYFIGVLWLTSKL